jgi:hypothetical protein
MQRLGRLLREPALRGLVFGLWLVLFSWPFWSDSSFRAIGFFFPYHLACWLALVLILAVMAWALRRTRPEDSLNGEENGQL